MSDPIGGNGGVGQNASSGSTGATALGPPPRAKRPLGAVVTSAIDNTRTLVKKQVELVKIEMTEAVSVRAKGAGMLAGAGVMALYALGFLAAAGSVALALIGRNAIKNAPTTPEQTQETLKEDARWARQQIAK